MYCVANLSKGIQIDGYGNCPYKDSKNQRLFCFHFCKSDHATNDDPPGKQIAEVNK